MSARRSTDCWRFLALALGMVVGSLSSMAADAPAHQLIEWPARAPSPSFNLVDERGRSRTPADYRGRPFMVLFGFSRCPDVCPAELFKLSTVLKQLGPAGERVQVLFITLDPEHDTRTALKRYVKTFNPRFQGLTGSAAQIDAAASSFHVNYAQVPADGDYTVDHSSSTFIFDAGGRLRLIGPVDAGVADYVHDLKPLIAEPRGA